MAIAAALTLALWPAPELRAEGSPLDGEILGDLIEHYVRDRAELPVTAIELPSLASFVREPHAEYDVSISSHPEQEMLGWVPLTVAITNRGQPLQHGVVTVKVESERRVVVARRAIRAGERLEASDLALEARPATELPNDSLDALAPALGKVLRRSARAGSPLRAGHLENAPSVRRGDRVRLRLRSGSLHIDASGQALEDGRTGEWIRVRNRDSRRTVEGRIADDGAVYVEL